MRASVFVVCLALLLVDVAPADSLGVRLIGSCRTAGDPTGVAVSEAYAYVADWDSGLCVVSLSDPSRPVRVGYYGMPCGAVFVGKEGRLAYLGSGNALQVLSLSDPAHPTEVGRCTSASVYAVAVEGQYLYGSGGGWLSVFSVKDPANPVEVGGCRVAEDGYDMAISSGHAYVADGSYGLFVVSIRDPANPVVVGELPGHVFGVAVDGDYAYVTDRDSGFRVVSIADPSHPVQVEHLPLPEHWSGGVAVRDGYAYVADEGGGLRVISVADPAEPAEVGCYDTPSAALDVAVYGDHLFVTEYGSGLGIYEFYGGRVDVQNKEAMPTIVRGVLRPGAGSNQNAGSEVELLDAAGRHVLDLAPGANDVRALAPGVYFMREDPQASSRKLQAVRKVIITR